MGDLSSLTTAAEPGMILPCQLSLFRGEFKTEPYKAEPKRVRGGEGVGAAHSSEDYRDNTTRYSRGVANRPYCSSTYALSCREGRPIAERPSRGNIFIKTLGCITTSEFHGEGLEGEELSESRVRENLMHGSMRGNWKNR